MAITPSGIEPVTFQLAAQCLNPLCYRMPPQLHNVSTNVGQASFWRIVTHKKYCIIAPIHCAGTGTPLHSYGIKHQKCTRERCETQKVQVKFSLHTQCRNGCTGSYLCNIEASNQLQDPHASVLKKKLL
jgi:hypothetical protein